MIEVFAPASIANFFVGFDILGLAFDQIGDRVKLTSKANTGLAIQVSNANVPVEVQGNTASMALQSVLDHFRIQDGLMIEITKGIPLSSGLGGSAASAVAAVFAVNEMYDLNMSADEMITHALRGEYVASKAMHADNLAPSLKGGLQFVSSIEPVQTLTLQLLPIYLAILHPHVKLETAKARGVLSAKIDFKAHIDQTQKLGTFMYACQHSDLALLQKSLVDVIVEPQRKHLIPGFDLLQNIALKEGAWAYTISGAGPTTVAVCPTRNVAEKVGEQMQKALNDTCKLQSDFWVSAGESQGARRI
jgi:homoserine kinase